MNTLDKAHFDYSESDFEADMSAIKYISEENTDEKSPSAADEILKYKQLLDMGVITQEEFDLKKKQLLNL